MPCTLTSQKKKNGRPVSRVLLPWYPTVDGSSGTLSFILPRHHCRSPAAYPSWLPCAKRNKAGSLAVPQQRQTIRIYMALQPVRRTAPDIAAGTGALLPHLFTRSPLRYIKTRWSFSVTLLSPFKDLPAKKHGALRCPDFPPLTINVRNDKAACRCKSSKISFGFGRLVLFKVWIMQFLKEIV